MSSSFDHSPQPAPALHGNADKVSPVRLQRRLLLLLIVPLCLLGLVSGWIDYRSASTAASQQDEQLQQLVPLLADSIIAVGAHADDPPVLLLAPPVEEFLKERNGQVIYKIYTPKRHVLHGDESLPSVVPLTREPEFFNQDINNTSYRIVVQRVPSVAGDVVVEVADSSDPRKHWFKQLAMKVLLPNLVMIGLVAFFVSWAVRQALRPLRDLTLAIERRSPRDLSSIDERGIPLEIRPLVTSLNWLFRMVNRQSEAQRRFIADAAHQLRTPIASLQAQIEAWSESIKHQLANDGDSIAPLPDAVDEAAQAQAQLVWSENGQKHMVQLPVEELQRLRLATRRTSQLVHQLLSLSRADAADTLELQQMQPVDLQALCEDVLERHLDAAAQKGIDLGLEVQAVSVRGHALWLQELLSNLLDNALQYTPASGIVTIRCGVLAQQEALQATAGKGLKPQRPSAPSTVYRAFLEVEDNGPGIAPADRARVLERFFRLPGSKVEGTGLGLPIAREIAVRHRSELLLSDGMAHDEGPGCGLRATVLFAPDLLLTFHAQDVPADQADTKALS
ncbi:MAG: sensor histidine kinase N-terminal domain-containing protein [Brachymonas sp.]|nr:sensor histidine kinase N-terminal domain-containing protein [Brachymonas sp.]